MGSDAALQGLRVLEFPGALTSYCGKLLADLGAEVIMVEHPSGSSLRRRPALLDAVVHDASVPFLYWGTNKKSVTADVGTPEGAAVFRRIAETADVVLEGFEPETLDAWKIGWDALHPLNSQLVLTSVTPFGQSGPFAHYRASDLVALALGGLLYMGGSPDEAPQQPSADLAYIAANTFAAIGTLLAVMAVEFGGEGQHVDVSMQESVCMALENALQYYDQESHVRARWAGTQRTAGQGVFPCQDGYIFLLAGGIAANRFWDPFVSWMTDEKVPDAELLAAEQWKSREHVESDEARAVFGRIFTSYSNSRTKESLYLEAQRRGIPLCPVNDIGEVWDNVQLRSRGYFVDVEDDERGLFVPMPSSPYLLSATPTRPPAPAPLLGADTAAVLAELGLSTQEQARLSTHEVI